MRIQLEAIERAIKNLKELDNDGTPYKTINMPLTSTEGKSLIYIMRFERCDILDNYELIAFEPFGTKIPQPKN